MTTAPRYRIPALSLRMVRERTATIDRDTCASSRDVAAIAQPMIGDRPIEFLLAIMVDGQAKVTAVSTIAQGGAHGMGVSAKDVLRTALMSHASGFVLVHNHPSGDATPSREDILFTAKVAGAGAVIGLPLLDHVIVTRDPRTFASVPILTEPEKEAA